MSKADYYSTLGVSKTASQDEIKKAYRKLAMQHHPDRHQGDKKAEKKFKELNEAYDILKDEEKRAAYDRFGHAAFQGGGPQHRGGYSQTNFEDISDIFGGIFNDFMGGGQQNRQENIGRGSDLRYNLDVALEEAYSGVKRNITYEAAVKCATCDGQGGKKPPVTCTSCGGKGKVRMQQGFFTLEQPCRTCSGTGKIVVSPCGTCHGQGREVKERTIAVSIPVGVDEGTRIRIAGEGEAGLRGAPSGDLYIFITIRKHKLFERNANDLYCAIPLKITTASLGGSIDVPTLDGTSTKISIPAGTQSGTQFRLKGKGMPILKSTAFGDLIVKVMLETPIKLTKRQRELLEEFEKETSNGSHPETESFFTKVKNCWDELKGG